MNLLSKTFTFFKAHISLNVTYLLVLVPLILLLFLFFRNAGVYPLVVDEYFYNRFTRLLPYSQAHYPNYLYYILYRPTNWCGDNFLVCVQFLNCLFYVGAFFPIYAIARRICSAPSAICIGIIAILAPFNYFTAFFMVEAPFFLGFFLFVWWLLIRKPGALDRYWIVSGFFLGLLSLIKFNGLFLFPAVLLYLLFTKYQDLKNVASMGQPNSGSRAAHWILSLLGYFAGLLIAKFGIAFLIAGPTGITFGGMYTGNLGQVAQQVFALPAVSNHSLDVSNASIFKLFYKWFGIIFAATQYALLNMLPLCFIYAPVIGSLVLLVIQLVNRRHVPGSNFERLVILTFLIFGNLLVLTVSFTWIAVNFGGETPYAHRRYYEFAYPLLLLCSVGLINQKSLLGTLRLRAVLGIFLAGAMMYVLFFQKSIYWHSDWFSTNTPLLYIWTALSLVILIVWVRNSRQGNWLFLWVLFPLLAIICNIGIIKHLQQERMQPSALLKASLFLSQHLDVKSLSRLMVAGYENNVMSTFYLKDANIPVERLAPGAMFTQKMFLPEKDWVLLLGDTPLDPALLKVTHQDFLPLGYATLFGGHGSWQLDFKKASWPTVVEKSAGLFFPPEPWGTWTVGKQMQLQFSSALPRKFELILTARAFGPNVGRPFYVELGTARVPFNLKAGFEKVIIELDNPLKMNSLTIYIPKPSSPKSQGLGDDDRLLGMAIEEMQIKW